MMCLWRVATLSRLLLLHITLSWPSIPSSRGTGRSSSATTDNVSSTGNSRSRNRSSSYYYNNLIQAHSIHPNLYTTITKNQHSDFFGRRRSRNCNRSSNGFTTTSTATSTAIRHIGTYGHRYNTLGRITLPSWSVIQDFLLFSRKLLPSRRRTATTMNHPYKIMATSTSKEDNTYDEVPHLSSSSSLSSPSLSHETSSSAVTMQGEEDNSDIFYRNDDDYCDLSASHHVHSNKRRRRTIWWMTDDDDLNRNEDRYQQGPQKQEDMNHNDAATHTHPSIETIQDVIRIKVRKPTRKKSDVTTKSSCHEQQQQQQQEFIESLTQPLMTESVWDQMTGMEWCSSGSGTTSNSKNGNVDDSDTDLHDQLLDALATMGESVARINTPTQWIDWQVHSSSSSSHQQNDDGDDILDYDMVQVWTGKCIATPPQQKSRSDSDDDDHHSPSNNVVVKENYLGIQLPFIKVRALLPYSVVDMVDLLLDSDRVVTYNPWSLGRKDCWIDTTGISITGTPTRRSMTTKIVQNRVQPPIPGARQVVSTTLLHARPIRSSFDGDLSDPNTTSWIIVSRSVGKNHMFNQESDLKAKTSRSDMLLGVNLLEPVRSKDGTILDTNHCWITTVAHAYSPSVPIAFAERMGVQSSIKFIQDIRNLKAKTSPKATSDSTRQTVQVTN